MSKSIGRNDPCPCGSGRKFERCCGDTGKPGTGSQSWDEKALEAAKLSLEFDAAKVESSIARLRDLLAIPGLTNAQRLQGIEYYATALQHHREHQLAIQQLEMIDSSWISANDHLTRVCIQFRKATSLAHLNKIDEALRLADSVAKDLDLLSPDNQAGILLELSRVYLMCGKTKAAEQACQRCVAESEGKQNLHEIHARALANLASIKLESGAEHTEAEGVVLMERAIELKTSSGDVQGLANSYSNLAFYYAKIKRYERAIAFYRKDLQLSRMFGDLHGLVQTLLHLADLYSHLLQPNLALKALAEANTVVDKLHNASLKEMADLLAQTIAARREDEIKAGEKLGPQAQCKCGSGNLYSNCCGRADFEPVSLPWDLNAQSEATENAYAELRAQGINPTRLDFFFRPARELHNRFAWYRVEARDGWAEILELPDVANIQLRTAMLSVSAANSSPDAIEHPLAAVIMSVCAAEAFINQVAFFVSEVSKTAKLNLGSLPPPLPLDPFEFQRKTELTLKWDLLGTCLCGPLWPPTPKLIHDFKTLVHCGMNSCISN